MGSICEILKVFLNKYFYCTVLSVGITLLINIAVPDKYWVITKIGINSFRVFTFCLIFSVFYGISYICKLLKKWKEIKEEKELEKQDDLQKKIEYIEKMRTKADEFSYLERKTIIDFIKTNNTPKKATDLYAGVFVFPFPGYYLLSTKNKNDEIVIKLSDEIFKIYSFIYEKYGMLGHFEEE